MEVLNQQETQKASLEATLSKLLEITPESLVRTQELGTALDFSSGLPVFERTLRLFAALKESNLDGVPLATLTELTQTTNAAITTFNQIQQFSVSQQQSPSQTRDALIQQVWSQYQEQFNRLSPIIAYSVRKGTDFAALEQQARTALEEIRRLGGEQAAAAKGIVAEANSTLAEVRRAAAEAGVAQHATHFREAALEHLRRSRFWLAGTIGLGVLLAAYGAAVAWYYVSTPGDVPASQTVQLAISKIIVFSVLYFGLVWAGRTFRAQWHNYVVNKHRQNALSTFETFVKAASDEQTKNAVLLQATQSIFAPQPSGFISQESDAGNPQIVEIVRSAFSGSKSAST